MNQVMISTLMSQIGSNAKNELSENLIRHMVLATILSYKKKFGAEFGQIVLAADDRQYWRKEIFPYYKAGRKKSREDSGFDWKLIFNTLDKLKTELRTVFPYKVIQVARAEADDIIGTLCKNPPTKKSGLFEEPEPILIVSADKDFMQLHKYEYVKQYSPVLKKFLRTDSPELFLKEHIIRGDRGDGIPNFLSSDAAFVDGKDKSKIYTKKVDEWLKQQPEEFCNEVQLKNYKRNERLVDLTFIPPEIEVAILEAFKVEPTGKKSMLFNYFIQNSLKNLMSDISDF